MSINHDSKQTNRVFSRLGARELVPQEVLSLHAASSEYRNTLTILTFEPSGPKLDDVGE